MFRLHRFMRELYVPAPAARPPAGPVVIWNLVRRCNLNCRHCYSLSADVDFAGELTTNEVFAVMDDLRAFGVPALVLSGGEPLLRSDIFAVSRRAKALGFSVALSSNGTLIDDRVADEIAAVGYDYVGISLDGIGAAHDAFRRREGAYRAALEGLRLCRERAIKVGVRFTLTEATAAALPAILDLVEEERVGRFYLSHLVSAGRGRRSRDAAHRATRRAMDLLFARCHESVQRGEAREVVTGNNDADAVYFLHWVRARFPDAAERIRARLVAWGGNSSGVNVANIDNLGNVHPDTYWSHHTLGNVRARPFSEIWRDTGDPVLARLRARPRQIGGRCARCRHFDICAGNTRIRALRASGDAWAEDPACYLTDREIGVTEAADAPSG